MLIKTEGRALRHVLAITGYSHWRRGSFAHLFASEAYFYGDLHYHLRGILDFRNPLFCSM